MGILSKIFSSKEVVEDVTESVIATGDKLVYTKEEKEEYRGNLRARLLKLYEPFKLIQRYLAIYFAWLFGFTYVTIFLLAIGSAFTEAIPQKAIENAVMVANAFSIGLIMLAIVGFYFGGGAVEGVMAQKAKNQSKDLTKLSKEFSE
jgi:hypothetical protein